MQKAPGPIAARHSISPCPFDHRPEMVEAAAAPGVLRSTCRQGSIALRLEAPADLNACTRIGNSQAERAVHIIPPLGQVLNVGMVTASQNPLQASRWRAPRAARYGAPSSAAKVCEDFADINEGLNYHGRIQN